MALFPYEPFSTFHMLPILITLRTADEEAAYHAARELQLDRQAALITRFFSDIDSAFLDTRTDDFTMREVCDWRKTAQTFALECRYGLVQNIRFGSVQHGNFQIGYTPHTVERLSIYNCKQRYVLETRTLPRGSKWVFFHRNLIFGTLDLEHLPPIIQTFDVSENRITGPIVLRNLPSTLCNLFIYSNRIQQEVLYYDTLPKALGCVSLGKNAIDAIRPIDEDTPKRDVFVAKGKLIST